MPNENLMTAAQRNRVVINKQESRCFSGAVARRCLFLKRLCLVSFVPLPLSSSIFFFLSFLSIVHYRLGSVSFGILFAHLFLSLSRQGAFLNIYENVFEGRAAPKISLQASIDRLVFQGRASRNVPQLPQGVA